MYIHIAESERAVLPGGIEYICRMGAGICRASIGGPLLIDADIAVMQEPPAHCYLENQQELPPKGGLRTRVPKEEVDVRSNKLLIVTVSFVTACAQDCLVG